MATTRMILTRSVLPTKQTLSSTLSRSYNSSVATLHLSSLLSLLPLSPFPVRRQLPPPTTVRGYATEKTSSSLVDPNPNRFKRPPLESTGLEGMDFKHWLFVLEKPEGNLAREEIINTYVKTLAQVVGSDDEARMKIYSVSTRYYFAFGALVSEELAKKVGELPKVRWAVPDSYSDVGNKDYGGEPFINGRAMPYDPKHHDEWVRNIVKTPKYLKPGIHRGPKPGAHKRPLLLLDRPKYLKPGPGRAPLPARPKYLKPGILLRHENRSKKLRSLCIPLQLSMGKEAFQC